jgi:hypothetical protein
MGKHEDPQAKPNDGGRYHGQHRQEDRQQNQQGGTQQERPKWWDKPAQRRERGQE